jgi:hypothetical protein
VDGEIGRWGDGVIEGIGKRKEGILNFELVTVSF